MKKNPSTGRRPHWSDKPPPKLSTLGQFIDESQSMAGIDDINLAGMLGYDNHLVIKQIKTGHFNLPIDKVPELARILGLNAAELLRKVLITQAPGTFEVIESVMDPLYLTPHEARLIQRVRDRVGDLELKPVKYEPLIAIAFV